MAAPLPEADRRRLLELRGLYPTLPVLVFHPLLTVVTGFGREASDSVVEALGRLGAPLGPAVSGTVEIGGQIRELPGALADPDARPEVVRGPMLVGEIGRRRAADAAIDVNKRAARVSRREAGLARRDQLVDRLEQLSTRADEIELELNEGSPSDDGEIQRLLVSARLPDPSTPNPIITALIDEWDALVVERKANSGGPTVERAESNLEAIRTRIAQREASDEPAGSDAGFDAGGVARAQEAHAAVERLAGELDAARRGERKAAGQKLANAVEAERQALAALGFESYASFLLAMAEGRGQDDGAHDEAALVTAESALSRAKDREQVFVLLSERELDLRARVARLLGRLPGPDVGAELRGGREGAAPSTGARARLEAMLRGADVPFGDDPIAAAERYLDGGESRRARSSALRAELEEIESEGSRLDEQLDLAENELAAAERDLIASVSGTLAGREAPVALSSAQPEELTDALSALVTLSGPPVVIGECFLEIGPQGRAALLDALGTLSRRRQVVVVTEVDAVAEWALSPGVDGVVWTPLEADAALRTADGVDVDAEDENGDEVTDSIGEVTDSIGVEPEAEAFAPEIVPPEVVEPPVVEAVATVEIDEPFEVVEPAESVRPAEPVKPFAPAAFDRPPVEPMVGAATAEAATAEPSGHPRPTAPPEVEPAATAPTESRPAASPPAEIKPAASTPAESKWAASLSQPAPERRGAWPPAPSELRFGWETSTDASPADEPAEPEPVPDFFAPIPQAVEPPAPAVTEAPAAPNDAPREALPRPPWVREPLRSVKDLPADPEAPAPPRARRVPALFDREAQEAADAAPVSALPVEVDAPKPAGAEPLKRNPLDDLFASTEPAEAKSSTRKKPKPPKARTEAEPKAPPPVKGRKRRGKQPPPPLPWEGRFDTSRQRDMPGKPVTPPPPGSAPLAVCVRHTGAVTRKRCARCGEPACDECLVTPRGKRSSMCIECAIIEAGVRSRRRLRG